MQPPHRFCTGLRLEERAADISLAAQEFLASLTKALMG
jgi:hypothetical protein